MADKKTKEWSPNNQIEIKSIRLFREGWADSEHLNIMPLVLDFDIYEDIFSPTISGIVTLMDGLNLPDTFPILRGERVIIEFKTPTFDDYQSQEFVIHRVGDRLIDRSAHGKMQKYKLYLCTPDRWADANMDISQSFKGRYDEILEQVLNILKSTKTLNKDETMGLKKFISPFWTPLRVCRWINNRAHGKSMEPFVFFETLSEYQFRSLRSLYKQEPVCKYMLEPKKMVPVEEDVERSFRSVMNWEYPGSADMLEQFEDATFGATQYIFRFKDKVIEKAEYDYVEMFKSPEATMLDKYPIVDVMEGKHKKSQFVMSRTDSSQDGVMYRKMVMALMGNQRMIVTVPGDSKLRVGSIIELDIPSRAGMQDGGKERATSGRWMIATLRHHIEQNRYIMALELVRDSYSINLREHLQPMQPAQTEQKRGE